MNARWKNRLPVVVVAGLVLAAVVILTRWQPARADRESAPAASPRYSVIETEGHNLIVTDNQKNTLYFYTIDKNKEVGSELKLRGSVDLTQVGSPVIKPKHAKVEK